MLIWSVLFLTAHNTMCKTQKEVQMMKMFFQKRFAGLMIGVNLCLGGLLFQEALAQVPIEFFSSTYWGAQKPDTIDIEQVIRQQVNLEDDGPYIKVKVKILYGLNGMPNRLIAHLLDKEMYIFDTIRIDLGPDLTVESVELGYEVQPEDMLQDPQEYTYATCPDESVDMVFAAITEFPSAIAAAEKATKIAQDAGYKTVTLIGRHETVQAYKDWLSCNNLMLLGRVGHGNTTGIMLSDGLLSYNYFNGLSATALNNKVLYFNSCQVHNPPLQPAIVNAGVQKYIGGIENLLVGSSEEVFKCFLQNVVAEKSAMTTSLQSCEEQHYPHQGHHGISGSGSDFLGEDNPEIPQVAPSETMELVNGQSVVGIAASQGQWLEYKIDIPPSAGNLKINISGGTGDSDLYTRFGDKATSDLFDCRPYRDGNEEKCSVPTPQAGSYYISLFAWDNFSRVNLTASYEDTVSPESPENMNPTNGLSVSDIAGVQDLWMEYNVDVPNGASNLKISISGGTGDADLYTRFANKPTMTNFDCRSDKNDNEEECLIPTPQAGLYWIGLLGYEDYSGVSLKATYIAK